MKYIATSPRTMSAWLSNLLTVPHHSLFLQDMAGTPHMREALEEADIPSKGIIENYIDFEPDCVIIRDKGKVKERLDILLQRDTKEVVDKLYDQLLSFDVPRYQFEKMDQWIEGFYEWATELPFDRTRYLTLKNLYIEGGLARWLRTNLSA